MTDRRAPDKTLTVQELESSHLARWDLGPGYPQTDVSDFIRSLYVDDTIEDLSLRFAPFWTTTKQRQLNSNLEQAVASFLGVDNSSYEKLATTFSGSIALDRALSGVQRVAREQGCEQVLAITTTPCIDIMQLFLEERTEVCPRFVESRRSGELGHLDVEPLITEIRVAAAESTTHVIVILTSPENPTGEVWSRVDLDAIADCCIDTGATLLVDHCFAMAGVHESTDVPRVWDLDKPDLAWLAVWDTGKTFGLNEDKLGFVFSGTPVLARAVDEAVSVLQFDVSRRQKLFFYELLTQASYHDHVVSLRNTCRTNLDYLVSTLNQSGIGVRRPPAGALAMIDLADTRWTDESARIHLLDSGVGVVAGNVFFHGAWRPESFLRVALSRDPAHFAAACDALAIALAEI